MTERAVRVNPIACEGHGLCAELLPERIALDEWGYPIVDPTPLTPALEKHAKRAVAACPRLALMLEQREVVAGRYENRGASSPRNAGAVST
jgi:ferredoxin